MAVVSRITTAMSFSWPSFRKAQPKRAETIDLKNAKNLVEQTVNPNQRFFTAIRDGGIWLC